MPGIMRPYKNLKKANIPSSYMVHEVYARGVWMIRGKEGLNDLLFSILIVVVSYEQMFVFERMQVCLRSTASYWV